MIIDSALYLASLGFRVFPLRPGSKFPMWRGWTEDATCNVAVVEKIWTARPDSNIGIGTTYYTNGTEWNGLGVDVDNKNGRRGTDSAIALGELLPETFVQKTPTGGYHYLYKSPSPLSNRVGSLGPGLDTRGYHGYVVGAGSMVPAGQYTIALSLPVAEAPAELVARIGRGDTRDRTRGPIPAGIASGPALAWAVAFVQSLPVALNGTINNSAFKASAALQNRGLAPHDIYAVMLEHFKSELPMDEDEIWSLALNAHKYAKGAPGSTAPEVIFQRELKPENIPPAEEEPDPDAGTPIAWMNESHAFVLGSGGGNILMEDVDSHSKPLLRVMSVEAFHNLTAGLSFTNGDGKSKQLSRVWMNSKNRRTFHGLEFAPGRVLPPKYYNLWRGFSYEPSPEGSDRAHRALAGYLHLVKHHVCRDNEFLNKHVMTWLAQMFQDPQHRPFVVPVIRGGKGSGKDTFLDIPGELLGSHYWLTAEKEDLVGRFNDQLGKILLFGLNEAFWAHDKSVESILKHLVTGSRLRIERKFCEPYQVDNLMRICIMGNEDVLVPATDDERRWLFLDMKAIEPDQQLAHYDFIREVRAGMEAGGYPLLLHYLLNYDITQVNINIAPNTEGLVQQKMASLPPVQAWFRECLSSGSIIGCGVPWPDRIDKELLRQAFRRWRKEHDWTGREPGEDVIGIQLAKMKLGIDGGQKRVEGGRSINQYSLPPLEVARKNWDVFIKAVKPTTW